MGSGTVKPPAVSLPRTGAWIETELRPRPGLHDRRRSLARERGLKQGAAQGGRHIAESLPRTGAWIETLYHRPERRASSGRSLARERGLKLVGVINPARQPQSLPRTGAWIETRYLIEFCPTFCVAPSHGSVD